MISPRLERVRDACSLDLLYELGLNTITELEIPQGIMASSREGIFSCIFGRDSLITSLKLLQAYKYDTRQYYLDLVKKILHGLICLQGKEINLESGEEPGKCIHEYRANAHERLTKNANPPWYLYPDGTMRNFDSIDSTPLMLIAIYRYFQISKDFDFIKRNEKAIDLAIDWILGFADKDKDGLVDYIKDPQRKSGGLTVQNWMDSVESVFHEDNEEVVFPVATVEVQAYVYLALRLWSSYYFGKSYKKYLILLKKADELRIRFNEKFIIKNSDVLIAPALDAKGKVLASTRSSIGHVLWASKNPANDGIVDCIIDKKLLKPLVNRLLQPDIFEPNAGIRTLSKHSRVYDPMSYHNGSIWPHDNSLIAEGMETLGFRKEANKVRSAIFMAYDHFQTPIELFVYDNDYKEFNSGGQIGCRCQAWSAASMIADSLALRRRRRKTSITEPRPTSLISV